MQSPSAVSVGGPKTKSGREAGQQGGEETGKARQARQGYKEEESVYRRSTTQDAAALPTTQPVVDIQSIHPFIHIHIHPYPSIHHLVRGSGSGAL